MTRKIIATTNMTLDGDVDQLDKWLDLDGGHGKAALEELRSGEALLLGRKSYEGFAEAWAPLPDDDGWATAINGMPKYVVSRTLSGELSWNATLLPGELVEAVTELKQQDGGDLLVYGCGEFAYNLARAGLVDEFRCWVYPVVWGEGQQLFHGAGHVPLELLGTDTFDSGVVLLTYRPRPES